MAAAKARPLPDFAALHPGYGAFVADRICTKSRHDSPLHLILTSFAGWVRAGNLLATAPKPDTLRLILKHQAACTSPGQTLARRRDMRWTTRAGGLAASSPRRIGSVPIAMPIGVAAIISAIGGRRIWARQGARLMRPLISAPIIAAS